jgi:guanine deaminase
MQLYSAFIVNPLVDGSLEYFPDGSLVVSERGVVEFVGTRTDARSRYEQVPEERWQNAVLMPGLVDTHVHLPQYEAAAIGTGELLDWLSTYIFPLEARFADDAYARTRSQAFFRDALSLGTTTMSVYCSSHKDATHIAFQAAHDAGIRVCMGKTMMDSGAPDTLLSSVEQNITDSLELAHAWHGVDAGRLQYTLTPRFAGSCSAELLRQTGAVARTDGFRIQTHLSENRAELRYIQERFPNQASYTDVYHAYGILTERTVMAHSIYLSPQERRIMRAHNCSLAHCPCSNRFLQSGVMPLRQSMLEGFRVGLGTDVAGGFSLSLLNEAKEAAESSKTWNIMNPDEELESVSAEEAVWLATLGGAQTLGLDKTIGNFAARKDADFTVFALDNVLPRQSVFASECQVLTRLIYGAGSGAVLKTFVRGQCVYEPYVRTEGELGLAKS